MQVDRDELLAEFKRRTIDKQLTLAKEGQVNVPVVFEIDEIVSVICSFAEGPKPKGQATIVTSPTDYFPEHDENPTSEQSSID